LNQFVAEALVVPLDVIVRDELRRAASTNILHVQRRVLVTWTALSSRCGKECFDGLSGVRKAPDDHG
jgi:hypothetical protein